MPHPRLFIHPTNGHKYEFDPYKNMVIVHTPDGKEISERVSPSLLKRLDKQGVPRVLTRQPAYVEKGLDCVS